ncbi:MAG TPA: alpha amylase C-terminal domain-containing protein [Tidjanibacter sp.]|nr:alpha amylase C-terminal domain-containing protein [Tidjanibacter sp.]
MARFMRRARKMAERLKIVKDDPWLEPVEGELEYRRKLYLDALKEIEEASESIADYADGYLYFGFQRDEEAHGWWFREWLPGAWEVFLFGDFNGWERRSLPLARGADGVWSIFLYDGDWGRGLKHGSLYKILVHGENGWHERIPAYARRVVQDDATKNFTAQFWNPEPFDWTGDCFDIGNLPTLYIYESHVGMAVEQERVGSYAEFARDVLPRIKRAGYNTVQLMGVAEHPYYGSFGYHVSSFFAPSSRFGMPEELKALIRSAHALDLAVVMDLVHAHYVKNLNEGLNGLDGTDCQYSPSGEEGYQPYWDSKLFDYSKPQVRHFLLSNIKYWLDEFRFDGFRFDGVTSMIYRHHGYTEFDSRGKYFGPDVNRAALTYLTLANTLVHEVRPSAVTIAEDVSGMPGMCIPVGDGGVGFDYRLGMAVPDFWIRMLKDVPDEDWNIWDIWNILTDRLPAVRTVAYAESHDQAMVGDQTIAFRLMDKEMYTGMACGVRNIVVERGIALHKMIRLVTIALGGQAYLNFMGNEFGHPEWIDFPREGNGWSYRYARRQWSLADDAGLRYAQLGLFDRDMLDMVERNGIMRSGYAYNHLMDTAAKTMVFSHGCVLFVFNWHPSLSIPDYMVPVPEAGRYRIILSTDDLRYGGQGRNDRSVAHFSFPVTDDEGVTRHYIKVYNICRTAVVYKIIR